jgi:ribosomal subunit interface protein
MNKRIVFKGMEHSQAIELFLREKLGKVDKFLEGEQSPIFFDIVMSSGSTSGHERNIFDASIRINGPHFSLAAHDEGYEMYAVIERAVDKIVKEINDMKKKRLKKSRKKDSFKGA